jgi:hypothetical protein
MRKTLSPSFLLRLFFSVHVATLFTLTQGHFALGRDSHANVFVFLDKSRGSVKGKLFNSGLNCLIVTAGVGALL